MLEVIYSDTLGYASNVLGTASKSWSTRRFQHITPSVFPILKVYSSQIAKMTKIIYRNFLRLTKYPLCIPFNLSVINPVNNRIIYKYYFFNYYKKYMFRFNLLPFFFSTTMRMVSQNFHKGILIFAVHVERKQLNDFNID